MLWINSLFDLINHILAKDIQIHKLNNDNYFTPALNIFSIMINFIKKEPTLLV